MPRPSKFTTSARERVLEALKVGASRRTAAALAGLGEATLRRWMEEGKYARGDSAKARFRQEVEEAEAHPRARALGIIYREIDSRPDLAWKFIERREPGYGPPQPHVPPQTAIGPVRIQLTLPGGRPLPLPEPTIEGEVEEEGEGDEPDEGA